MVNSDFFLEVIKLMSDAAFLHDSEGRLIYVNKAYEDLAGLRSDELIGERYWHHFPKREGPLSASGDYPDKPDHSEIRSEFMSGSRTYASMEYSPGKYDGHNTHSLHLLMDITNIKSNQEKIAEIEEHFTLLYSLSPDAIMLLDEKGFFECNPATLKIFGCKDRSEFIGRHPAQFSPSTQADGTASMLAASEKIAKAIKEGSNLFEWTHCRIDGSIFPAEVLLVAFKRNGKLVLQATVRDITDRKNIENQITLNLEKLNSALSGVVATMSKTMELRDPYTAGHQTRVAYIACLIANELGWNDDQIQGLRMAALVHDIGKIAIPAEILTKPSRLSEFEEKLMQEHAEHGYELLKDIDFPWPIADIVHQHHERMDGSGYPFGIKGEKILPGARILAVADTLEAMSTHRPYRPAVGLPSAVDEIKKESGKQLDEVVVAAAVKLFEGKDSLDLLEA